MGPAAPRTRRQFLKAMGLGAGAVLTGCQAWRGAPRPNLLLLLTDDQRWDTLGCAGNPVIRTPNLDRLGSEGVLFRNAFVTTSICPSSRASILTGQYTRRHGVRTFFQSLSDAALAESYPALLRAGGYYTGFLGKWGIDAENPAGLARVARIFDHWAGFSHQGNYWHDVECPFVVDDGRPGRIRNVCTCPPEGPEPRIGREGIARPRHMTTEILPARFARFLDTRDPARPFCLSVSFKACHAPLTDWDPSLGDLYEGAAMPRPPSVSEEHAAAQPAFLRASPSGGGGAGLIPSPEARSEQLRHYYRLISGIDVALGHMRRALAERELAEDTVILFSSDNGLLFGEHGLASKWLMHEESIRVPLIVVDPRLGPETGGATSDALALNLDIAPTLLELAGLAPAPRMQGRSLFPLLLRPAGALRDDWFYEHHFKTTQHPIERTEGIREARWKYVRYLDQQPAYEQLFDLEADPYETRDLAGLASQAANLDRLRGRWARYRRKVR